MKYNITTLQKEVPANIRLEIYREALERLNTTDGLCLLLPTILFDLENCNEWYIDTETKRYWDYADTPNAFPELTCNVLGDIEEMYWVPDEQHEYRKTLLGEWIVQLENRLSQTITE